MISLFRRSSSFRRALEATGLERCSTSGTDLWVGLPPDTNYKRLPVLDVPDAPRSVLFVEGPEQAQLIAAFADSPEAITVENLMIGTSHDYIPGHRTPYDFSAAIAALVATKMPALKRLIVGEMELLFNGHGYYGHLGDMTELLGAAPNLVELRICGRAEFTRPVRHQRLQVLSIFADDIAGNSGATDPETVSNLLSSHFPELTELYLSLETDAAPSYVIPEAFYSGGNMPALRDVEIDCLAPDDLERLETWKSDRHRLVQDT